MTTRAPSNLGNARQGLVSLVVIGCAAIAWVIWLQQKQVSYEEQERETNADRVKWLQTADYWMHHPAESMPEVLEYLAGDDVLARRSAGLALGQIGPAARDWVPEIAPLMDHQDPLLRQCALLCLARQKVDLGPWMEPIAARLADDDSGVREAAARAIAHLGIRASPAASRTLVTCDRDRTGIVMTVLSHLGTDDPEALARIHGIFRDQTADPGLRQVAFWTLRALEQLDADDAEAGLRSNEPVPDSPTLRSTAISELGWASVRSISELHLTSHSLLDAFQTFLARQYKVSIDGLNSDSDVFDKAFERVPPEKALIVISAAANLGIDASRLIPRLEALGWGRTSVRLLREINRDEALRLLPGFLEQASDLTNKDCSSGWSALQGMGPEASGCVPLIVERLHLHPRSRVAAWIWMRDEGLRMTEQIGPAAAGAIPDLILLISSQNPASDAIPSPELDLKVFAALGAIGPASKAAVPVIVAWLNEPPAQFQSAHPFSESASRLALPIDALRRIGAWNQEIENCLRRLQKHESPHVREAALEALAELDPEHSRAVDALVAALNDPYYLVRQASASALGDLGQAAKEAIPALHKAAEAPENAVPPEIIILGDEQILKFGRLRRNYQELPGDSWPVFVRERTVREAALESIRQIESNPNP